MRKGIMLATKYTDGALDKWPNLIFAQPKVDGVRCLAKFNPLASSFELFSSQGNKITSVIPVVDELNLILNSMLVDMILDGELYSHTLPFERISGACRRKDVTPDVSLIRFLIFDWKDTSGVCSQASRIDRLAAALSIVTSNARPVQRLETYTIRNDPSEIDAYMSRFLTDDWEGIILRHPDGKYEEKRSKFLVKIKPTKVIEARVVDYEEEISIHGERKCTLGSLLCHPTDPNIRCFRVGTGPFLTDERREFLWKTKDKLIDMVAVVRFQELTKYKVPRFPVLVSLERQG